MHAKDAIRQTIGMADMIMSKYLNDLDDSALMVRPVAGMNHIAWQLGHLISSERGFIEGVKPGSCPPLPEGFEARHKKDTAASDDASKFLSKAEYLAAWNAQRAATKAALDSLSDADLDAPSPENIRNFCPTVGQVFNLAGLHPLMHVGQFVAVRRDQKLPVAF
jgi:hypothetical protein